MKALRHFLWTLAGLIALAGVAWAGTTAYDTYFVVRSGRTNPTCATATVAGELCANGDIETNGNLDVAGTATLTGATTQTGDLTLSGGASALTFSGSASSIVVDDADATALLIGSTGDLDIVTIDTSEATEKVIINGTTTATALQVDVGNLVCDEDATVTGDLSLGGGATALTFSAASSSIVVPDASATGLVIGSSGDLDILTLVTSEATEKLAIKGTTTADAFHVDVGTSLFDEGVAGPTFATHLETIRFCGNGSATGIADYIGPVLLDDTEADLAFGGAGCDALNSATEATADAPWHAAFAFKPVAMVCVGLCTGAAAANDAITYQLRDDAADVTGMACTASAWTGDQNPQQCTVRDSTPLTVAAGSTVAIKTIGTDDACADAGDDFECLVYVTF